MHLKTLARLGVVAAAMSCFAAPSALAGPKGPAAEAPASKPLYFRDSTSAALPTPIQRPDGITLPQAAPDGGDLYLYDADPAKLKEKKPGASVVTTVSASDVAAVAAAGEVSATAQRLRTPGGGLPESITCQSTGFWRNYNPSTDNFSDLDYTYHFGEIAYTRAPPYRRWGPRGVIAYRNKWGFISVNCLSGQ